MSDYNNIHNLVNELVMSDEISEIVNNLYRENGNSDVDDLIEMIIENYDECEDDSDDSDSDSEDDENKYKNNILEELIIIMEVYKNNANKIFNNRDEDADEDEDSDKDEDSNFKEKISSVYRCYIAIKAVNKYKNKIEADRLRDERT